MATYTIGQETIGENRHICRVVAVHAGDTIAIIALPHAAIVQYGESLAEWALDALADLAVKMGLD